MKTTLLLILTPFILNGKYIAKPINIKPMYELVTLTTYTATKKETDSTPNITASGFKIDTTNPKKHRIIAVSRDLKAKYNFGSKIKIINAGRYNGYYYVKDLMNKRWKNRIDILVNSDDKQTKLYNIKIIKL
jgi:3D (Asp-Asp-Asp) domain-containing protein